MPYKDPAKQRKAVREAGRRHYARKKAAKAAARLPSPIDPKSSGEAKAAAVARWAKRTLVVPPGHPLVGQPMALPGYAQEWLAAAFEAKEASLTMARKNAKSAIVAIAYLSFLVGPTRREGFRGAVCSVNLSKANELRMQIESIAIASGLQEHLTFRRSPYPGLISSTTGTVECLSSDKNAGHASSFDVVCCDETGLFPERARELLMGLRTSVSAKNGSIWHISIRGNSPLFGEILERGDLPDTHVQIYAAEEDCALDDRAAWKAANPGLGSIKSVDYMIDQARRAAATPIDQNLFKAFDLNLPVAPDADSIITVDEWKKCEVETLPAKSGQCYVGIDLGGSRSMTAAVAYWPETGRMDVFGAFANKPDLRARGRSDGVGLRYERMQQEGHLRVYGQNTVDVAAFLQNVFAMVGQPVAALGADRFRRSEVLDVVEKSGLRCNLVFRGTGASATADGSHDVRSFQRGVQERKIKAERCTLWRLALAGAILRYDRSGNPALDRANSKARQDAVAAAIIATGLAALAPKPVSPKVMAF